MNVFTKLLLGISAVLVVLSSVAAAPSSLPMLPMIAMESGNYDITKKDITELLKTPMKDHLARQKEDRDYFVTKVNLINAGLENILKEVVYDQNRGAAILSQRIYLSKTVSPEEYFWVKNQLAERSISFNTLIKSISAISEGALPSASIETGDQTVEVPNYGNFDMSGIVNYYQGQFNVIVNYVNNLAFRIKFDSLDGQYVNIPAESGKALNWKFNENIIPISSEELTSMKNQALDLRNPFLVPGMKRALTALGSNTSKQVSGFVYRYGSSEKYRFRNEDDEKAAEQEYKELLEIFWSRSYMRAVMGSAIGSFSIQPYKKRWANIDFFTNATELKFREQMAYKEPELKQSREDLRNLMEVIDVRGTKVFEGNTSFLTMANVFVTFAKGDRPKAEMLKMVIRLIANDNYEEVKMLQSGGLKQVYLNYIELYQSSKQQAAETMVMACQWDSVLAEDPESGCPSDDFSDVGALQPGSVKYDYNKVLALMDVYQVNLEKSLKIEEQVKLATMAADSSVKKKANNRRRKLTKPGF